MDKTPLEIFQFVLAAVAGALVGVTLKGFFRALWEDFKRERARRRALKVAKPYQAEPFQLPASDPVELTVAIQTGPLPAKAAALRSVRWIPRVADKETGGVCGGCKKVHSTLLRGRCWQCTSDEFWQLERGPHGK